jgi:hypothetical protein
MGLVERAVVRTVFGRLRPSNSDRGGGTEPTTRCRSPGGRTATSRRTRHGLVDRVELLLGVGGVGLHGDREDGQRSRSAARRRIGRCSARVAPVIVERGSCRTVRRGSRDRNARSPSPRRISTIRRQRGGRVSVTNSNQRTEFGAPARGRAAGDREPRGRSCGQIGCTTVLSTYNSSDHCWLHTPATYRHPLSRR